MAEKKVNYTEAQTAALVSEYQAGKSVDDLAEAMGRARKSVIAKLVREGVYVAAVKVPAVKDEGPTKKELLATLRELAPEISSEGIGNATKDALTALIARLTPTEAESEAA